LELFKLPALTIELGLIRLDLSLLIGLPDLLTLELIADQGAGAQAKRAADGCAGTRVTHGRSNNAADGSATQRADSCAFFARGQTAPRATRQRTYQQNRKYRRYALSHRALRIFGNENLQTIQW
jgi:hypothetical protein